ncbi:hypothetical protein Lfu02_54470 [Longispora fulva]|nr:hypothetical protein Lfu02_54470 [Longispora fulva]
MLSADVDAALVELVDRDLQRVAVHGADHGPRSAEFEHGPDDDLALQSGGATPLRRRAAAGGDGRDEYGCGEP